MLCVSTNHCLFKLVILINNFVHLTPRTCLSICQFVCLASINLSLIFQYLSQVFLFLSASSHFYKRSCLLVGWSQKRLKCAKRLILMYFFHAPPHSYSVIHSFIHSFLYSFIKNVHSQNLNQARRTYYHHVAEIVVTFFTQTLKAHIS